MLISVMKIMKPNDTVSMCQDITAEWNAREETKVLSEILKAMGQRPSQGGTLALGPGCSKCALGWEVGVRSDSLHFDTDK